MEYIFTDLPRYVKVTDRSRFSNAVIHDGYVLLFSQDGQSLTAKLPNGSFVNVGGSDSFSFSQVTATASDVLAGKFFHNSSGILVEGTIQTVTAAVSANKIVIPRGFIESDSITIPQADPLVVSGNTVTVPVGYIASQRVAQIAQGGSLVVNGNVVHVPIGYRAQSDSAVIAEGGPVTVEGNVVHIPAGYRAESDSVSVEGGQDVILGVVDAQGKFQPFKFNGTEASDSGQPITVSQYKSWNSTLPAPTPSPSGGMDFYKCVSVNTSTQTWTGHLYDVINQSLSAEITSLTYTSAVAPSVGKYYSEDGTLEIDHFSQNKLVFYAPLNSASSSAATGQSFTTHGNSIVYGTVDGVPCATFDGSSYIQFSDATLPVLKNDATFSCFVKSTNTIQGSNDTVCCYGFNSGGTQFRLLALGQNRAGGVGFAGDAAYVSEIEVSGWKHLAFVCSNGQPFLYLNGSIIAPSYNELWSSVSTQLNGVATIGTEIRNGSSKWPFIGSMAELKMWKRALSQTEITAEYTRLHNMITSN